MFGFSFWEVFLILVVALLVIGPERLPEVARKVGEWTYKVRKFVANTKAEMESEFNIQDMKQLLNSQESELSKLRALVEETRHDLSDTGNTLKSALSDAEQTMRDSAAGEQRRRQARDTGADDEAPGRLKSLDDEDKASTPTSTPAESGPYGSELSQLETETGESFQRPFPPLKPDPSAKPTTTQEATAKNQDEPKERGRDN